MRTQVQRASRPWGAVPFTLGGLLLFVYSFFALPIITASVCLDGPACVPITHTAWWLSQNLIDGLPVTPIVNAIFLVLLSLPFLAAVVFVGCGCAFLLAPRRTLLLWCMRCWAVGILALFVQVPFLFFVLSHPGGGFVGMLGAYALFWAGYSVLWAAGGAQVSRGK